MSFVSVWRDLREQAASLGDDAVLVTPRSERPFIVDATADDRIIITFREDTEERILWRNQFKVLYDRLVDGDEDLSMSSIPPGVEPYAAVLSLGTDFTVDGTTLQASTGAPGGKSPFLHEAWEVRTTPERVHDDALLLAETLERYPVGTPEALDTDDLVNLYVLLSDVQREADRLRSSTGDILLDRIGPDGTLTGQFGSVARTERQRRRLKPTEAIFAALEAHRIPEDWVIGIDRDKLDVVLSVTDVEETDVYDIDTQVYVRKADVEEREKQSRLEGLKARLDAIDDETATTLHDEIETLERRIDEVLAAG